MISSDLDTYFANTDTVNNGITGCTLYENDCSIEMIDPISIDSSTPFDVTARRDIPEGYSETICIECTNGI
jgi:hypothetical protein